jgi:hydroxymethylglutaryl-CoA lyase
MAGSDAVFTQLQRHPGVIYSALTPNLTGLQRALACGVDEVAVFAAASEGFSQKNINCSIAESLARFVPVVNAAHTAGLRVRGYVSCVVGCPYDGAVAPQQVAAVARQLLELGCYEVSLGDTTGVGSAGSVARLLQTVLEVIPAHQLAVHFHDTYGQALANIVIALQHGISTVDSSVAGLGGCPYARGASGNVATEDVVYLLSDLGIAHGIDLPRLIAAGDRISAHLGRANPARVARALSPGTCP